MNEVMKQWILWAKEYSWGRVLVGGDPEGFLILWGVNRGSQCYWNSKLVRTGDAAVAVGRAQKLAEEISKDPISYATLIQLYVAKFEPPRYGYCRCVVEPLVD
jgi:hypothetical protein